MPQSWCPEEVLNLCGDGRCIGFAPSKGRKCRMPISGMNQSCMDNILDGISNLQPDPAVLRSKLIRLAGHGLCVRFHRDQIHAMVDKWSMKIRAAFPESGTVGNQSVSAPTLTASRLASLPPAPRQRNISDQQWRSDIETLSSRMIDDQQLGIEGPQHRPSTGSRTSPSRSLSRTPSHGSTTISRRSTATTTISSTPSLPAHSEIETLQETIAAMQETIRTAQRRLEELRYLPPSNGGSVAMSRVSTSDISSLQLSRSSTTQSTHTSTSSQRPRSPIPLPSVTSTVSSAASSTASSTASSAALPSSASAVSLPVAAQPVPSSPRSQSCNLTHARRRSLNEECSICYDDVILSQTPDELVWCKAECGRSVHRECFVAWKCQWDIDEKKRCEEDGRQGEERSVACTMCRTTWVDDCDC